MNSIVSLKAIPAAIVLSLTLAYVPSSFARKPVTKPLPICANYQAMVAYKMASAFVTECDSVGIRIDKATLKGNLQKSMANDGVFTVAECNSQCAVLDAFNNQKMDSCVESLSDSALKGALNGATFTKAACEDARNRFGK